MGRLFSNFDWITAFVLGIIAIFGLFVLLTISQGLFFQQLFFVIVGFGILVIFSQLDPLLIWWLAPIGYVVSLVFLIFSYLGPAIRGATRWIVIAGYQFQPSELVKPLILLAFARFISQYPPRKVRNLPLHIILFLIPFVLVFKQPDLGSSLVYAGIWLSMMLAGGLPLGIFVVSVISAVTLLPFGWRHLAPYQQTRITMFLNPAIDPKGAGYNAVQSMIAVGSGLLFGRGLGRGTQSHLRFLPEYHTDFIFATLVEELGFAGGFLLICGYGLLLWRILLPLMRRSVNQAFPYIYSVGLFGMLLAQIFINSGMNMGIIPITGITLPLVSYGGSSIIATAISFGLLWAITRAKHHVQSIA
jgi:rod shape determining protein RodA